MDHVSYALDFIKQCIDINVVSNVGGEVKFNLNFSLICPRGNDSASGVGVCVRWLIK